MNKLLIALLAVTLVGCAGIVQRPPLDVSQIPNDCTNRNVIIGWLEREASAPRGNMESKEDYERHRGQIRSRIWNMRYTCQPV
jgi:hypothetical protein